jgi:hypothetical protein
MSLLLAETFFALVVLVAILESDCHAPELFIFTAVIIAVTVVFTAVYYPLGRYFLEICRTKQNFIAAPPLVDNPLDVALEKTSKHPCSVDHPKKTGGMFGVLFLALFGFVAIGVWYFAQYSWNKHPIPLGICVVLTITIILMPSVWEKKVKKTKNKTLLNVLSLFCAVLLVFALEYIEFGGLFYFFDFWSQPSFRAPYFGIHIINTSVMLFSVFFIPIGLRHWWKANQKENNAETTDEDALLREAISRYNPATMTADEPEVAAKPFPKRWLWIIGLYAAAIVVMWCVGVLVLNY